MLDHTETVMNIQERFDSRVIIILTLSIHNIIQKISSDVYLSDHNNWIVDSSSLVLIVACSSLVWIVASSSLVWSVAWFGLLQLGLDCCLVWIESSWTGIQLDCCFLESSLVCDWSESRSSRVDLIGCIL